MAEIAGDPGSSSGSSLLDYFRYQLDIGVHPFAALYNAVYYLANQWVSSLGADTWVDPWQ